MWIYIFSKKENNRAKKVFIAFNKQKHFEANLEKLLIHFSGRFYRFCSRHKKSRFLNFSNIRSSISEFKFWHGFWRVWLCQFPFLNIAGTTHTQCCVDKNSSGRVIESKFTNAHSSTHRHIKHQHSADSYLKRHDSHAGKCVQLQLHSLIIHSFINANQRIYTTTTSHTAH